MVLFGCPNLAMEIAYFPMLPLALTVENKPLKVIKNRQLFNR